MREALAHTFFQLWRQVDFRHQQQAAARRGEVAHGPAERQHRDEAENPDAEVSDEIPFYNTLSKHEFIGNYNIWLFPVIFYDDNSNPFHKSDAILDDKLFNIIFKPNQLDLIFNSLGYNIDITENQKIPGLYYLEVGL